MKLIVITRRNSSKICNRAGWNKVGDQSADEEVEMKDAKLKVNKI